MGGGYTESIDGESQETPGEMKIPLFCPSDKPIIQYEPSVGMLLPDGALLIQCNGEREAEQPLEYIVGES